MTALAIIVPLVAACLAFASKRLAWSVCALTSIATLVISIMIFMGREGGFMSFSLVSTPLSSGIFLAASFITLLIVIYSKPFMNGSDRINEYYCYILICLGSCAGVFFSNDFLTMLLFWDILAAMLYMLIGINGGQNTAAKALLIIGSTDVLMIVGIAIVLSLTRTLQIGMFPVPVDGLLPWFAFICLTAGALAKAGSVPLHTWIPEAAGVAPVTVMALLPAALDKLLGIYFLFRIVGEIFIIDPGSPASTLLLSLGSLTIIFAVMGALMQHNIKKLLAFHAVSQVGYMVIGIGCANPIGIAGGLFHMLNNAIYKTGLFLTAGSVEKSTGTTEMDSLGGLSKALPFTFIATLIAALSISGVPPFNGFFSKWMIYQGIIDTAQTNNLWIIWLTCAMFGSALTLASFIKLIYSVFLGQPSAIKHTGEGSPLLYIPSLIFAAICVLFGVFALQLPLNMFIFRSVQGISWSGFFSPITAAALLIAGLCIGFLIYAFSNTSKVSPRSAYIGGELIDTSAIKVSGNEFYKVLKDYMFISMAMKNSEKYVVFLNKIFYRISDFLHAVVSFLHNGILNTYIAWMLLGAVMIWLMLVLGL